MDEPWRRFLTVSACSAVLQQRILLRNAPSVVFNHRCQCECERACGRMYSAGSPSCRSHQTNTLRLKRKRRALTPVSAFADVSPFDSDSTRPVQRRLFPATSLHVFQYTSLAYLTPIMKRGANINDRRVRQRLSPINTSLPW